MYKVEHFRVKISTVFDLFAAASFTKLGAKADVKPISIHPVLHMCLKRPRMICVIYIYIYIYIYIHWARSKIGIPHGCPKFVTTYHLKTL